MSIKKYFNLLFEVKNDKPELNRARYKALSKQIPIMYGIVMVDMLALSYTHFNHAPIYLALLIPALLLPLTIYRSVMILKTDIEGLTDREIKSRLQTINYLAVIIGVICISWAINLMNYGDAYTNSHAAFFICLTSIGVITCLMHLYQSAIIISAVVVVPGAFYFALSDQQVFNAISVNILLVVGAMLFVMFRYSLDFTNLIENQQKLEQQSKIMKILNTENVRLANLDSLTMLPNRRSFFAQLNKIIQMRTVSKDPFVVGMLDLDGFKQVNDLYGHPVGDQLLIDVSDRLKKALNKDAFLARLGGDEFGIIFNNPGTEQELMEIGNQICNILRIPFEMQEGTAKVAGTVGFATFPTAGETATTLFERADYALCYSKQNCKGTVVMFSEEHETIIREVSTIAHRLREADLTNELNIVYQPVVNSAELQTVSFEALARWESPVLGNIPPNVFIRSAEQSGMISQLTAILLKKTLETVSKWPDYMRVSFNLSTFDLCSHESTLKLLTIIKKSGVSPKRITLEITETAVMQDYNRALEGLNLFRQLGCKIALDDFGTGYSSLSYIQRMPIDKLKIDRSFILDIETSKATRDIVRTIADLCRNLNLECVVEGVETKEQIDLLTEMGLNIIQGYYFSQPLNEADALKYMQNEIPSMQPRLAIG